MILTADTVVTDYETTMENGAVVVKGDVLEAVGRRDRILEEFPGHERYDCDVLAPGLVGSHIHSVQSLGRGMADDTALMEWLSNYVLPMEANLTPEATHVAAQLGYAEMISSGITTAIDHLSVNHTGEAVEAAVEAGIRVRLGKVLMDQNAPEALREDTERALDETQRLIEEHHGRANDRIQYAITPRFAVSCSETCLRGVRELADSYEDTIIHSHTSENRDEIQTVEEATGMRNVHWLHEVGITGEDVVLAHAIWTDPSERQVLEETNTSVVYCPSSNMKLASGIAPITDYLNRGINVTLGNDGPPCNNTLDPFTEMRNGTLLQKVDALEPEVLSARTMLKLATVNGAIAAGLNNVGKLEEGWKADVIGVDFDEPRTVPVHDVISHLVYATHGDDVQLTMVDGTLLQVDGQLTNLDTGAIRSRAQNEADRLEVP